MRRHGDVDASCAAGTHRVISAERMRMFADDCKGAAH